MMQLFDSGLYADVTLRFCDVTAGDERLCLRVHRSVLFASQIDYFRRLIAVQYTQANLDVLSVHMDFAQFTPQMVATLVRLIYTERLSRRTLGDELNTYVNENLLHFYQLALFFTFDALQQFCLKRLSQQMCASLFEVLTEFCLMTDSTDAASSFGGGSPRYYVPHEKMPLYQRMIRWRHHCADKQPHLDIAGSGSDSSGERTEPLLVEHERHVTNFPFDRLPQKRIDRQAQRVSYHRSLCRRCLASKETPFYNLYMIKLGRLALSDHSVACEFSLARDRSAADRFALWLKYDAAASSTTHSSSGSSDDDHMSVEYSGSGSDEMQRLRTSLRFFSKRVDEEPLCAQSSVPLGTYGEVLSFVLPDRHHCYEAQCGGCQQRKSVYIIEITVDIVNEPPFSYATRQTRPPPVDSLRMPMRSGQIVAGSACCVTRNSRRQSTDLNRPKSSE